MMNLKDAWTGAMRSILNEEVSEQVEDYLEVLDVKITFDAKNAEQVLCNDYMKSNFEEMKKVFFSQEENRFGHNYSEAVLTPLTNGEGAVKDMVTLLKKNNTTRKAVLTYIPYGNEKIPCINCIHFMIRQGKLNISYFSRGQDIYKKFPCDALCIIEMGRQVADALGIPVGTITANITSAHVYLSDVEAAKEYCQKTAVPKKILTGNAAKYDGLKNQLSENNFELLIRKLDLPEIQSTDFEKVIAAKAKAVYEALGEPVWVDDMGLLTEAYESFPGPLTKYLFKTIGVDGLKLLLDGRSKRAKMVCYMAYYDGAEIHSVHGECNGILNLDNPVADKKMPLKSVFICDDPMKHRSNALHNVFQYKEKSM